MCVCLSVCVCVCVCVYAREFTLNGEAGECPFKTVCWGHNSSGGFLFLSTSSF